MYVYIHIYIYIRFRCMRRTYCNILSRIHCQQGFAENLIIPAWVTRDAGLEPMWVADFSATNGFGLRHVLSMLNFTGPFKQCSTDFLACQ